MTKLRAFLYLGGVASIVINTALVWPVIGRILSPSQIGMLSSVLAASALLAPVTTLGIHSYTVRFVAQPVAGLRDSAIRVGSSATWLLSACAIAAIALGTVNDRVSMYACVLFAQASALVSQAIIRGADRPWLFFAHAICTQTLLLVVVCTAQAASSSFVQSLTAASVWVALSSVAFMRTGLFQVQVRSPSPDELRAAMRFSLPLLPHLFLGVGLLQGVRVLVGGLDGAVALSIFQYGALVGGAAITVVQAVSGHLGTDVLRTRQSDTKHALQSMHAKLLLTVILLTASIVVFKWLMLDLWLPPSITPSGVTQSIAALIPAALFQATGDVSLTALLQTSKTASISLATGAGAAVAGLSFIALRQTLTPEMSAGLAITFGLAARAAVSIAFVPTSLRSSVRPPFALTTATALTLVAAEAMILASGT